MNIRVLSLKTFKESNIKNTPINWFIWKRAFELGYNKSFEINKAKGGGNA